MDRPDVRCDAWLNRFERWCAAGGSQLGSGCDITSDITLDSWDQIHDSDRIPPTAAGRTSLGTSISSLIDTAERGDLAAATRCLAPSTLSCTAWRDANSRAVVAARLGVTTLLHEAYLDIAERDGPSFPDRPRFMRYAASVMRGLIIEHARRRCAIKRGGQFEITSLGTDIEENVVEERALTGLSDALDALARIDPSLVEVVDMKFFCGFSFAEIGAMRGVSERTVQRQWEKARIYLHGTLRGGRSLKKQCSPSIGSAGAH